jgi:glycosyltransferase involved in cell wall biosynthesis
MMFLELRQEIAQNHLDHNVTFLGQRHDVPRLLRACDIGVLSSKSEGLPVSLLEYGLAELPVVATRVGQCEEVLDFGRAGILVPSQSPAELAEALLSLLESPERRASFGQKLLHRMKTAYSAAPIMKQITGVYDDVLASKRFKVSCAEPIRNSAQA